MSEGAVTLGRRLAAERGRKSLSVQKVADELHLDGWVIETLESGDYARLGPAVYGKGHLKRYLALLGLPAVEIEGAYAAESPPPVQAAQPASLRMRTSDAVAGGPRWVPAAVAMGVLAVVAVLCWWRPWHARAAASASLAAPAMTSATQATQPQARAGDGMTGDTGIETAGDGAAASGAPGDAPATAVGGGAATMTAGSAGGGALAAAGVSSAGGRTARIETGRGPVGAANRSAGPAPPGDIDPNAGTGRARLRLSFSSDSWVDVHDALGQRVYAGNGRANSVKTIAGAAPLRVYLKSASGVQMEINNHAVAIGPRFVVGNVAHFEAGADGVLRRDSRAAGVAAADGVLRRDSHALGAPSAASSSVHPRG